MYKTASFNWKEKAIALVSFQLDWPSRFYATGFLLPDFCGIGH